MAAIADRQDKLTGKDINLVGYQFYILFITKSLDVILIFISKFIFLYICGRNLIVELLYFMKLFIGDLELR